MGLWRGHNQRRENLQYLNTRGATRPEIQEIQHTSPKKIYNAQPQRKKVVPLNRFKNLETDLWSHDGYANKRRHSLSQNVPSTPTLLQIRFQNIKKGEPSPYSSKTQPHLKPEKKVGT